MVLEGGGYRCYENYCIEIKDSAGNPHPNFFDLSDAGQKFQVSICDCLNSNNCCWGYVTIELKLVPELECPADITLACNEDALARYPKDHPLEGQLITGEAALLTCVDNAKITFIDYLENEGSCKNPRATITRRWKVVGKNGMESSCDQLITFEGFDAREVQYPKDFVLESSALAASKR